MKSFELTYTIEEDSSWRGKDGIKIKSNLADDKLINCEIAKSLVDHLKTESATLDPDKFLLAISEAQKREIQTSLENMDMALQAKIHSDKAHEILSTISSDAEERYSEIEKKFSETEKRFTEKMNSTSEKIKKDLAVLTEVVAKLTAIYDWKLKNLTESLAQVTTLFEKDPELMKLVLEFKRSQIKCS